MKAGKWLTRFQNKIGIVKVPLSYPLSKQMGGPRGARGTQK